MLNIKNINVTLGKNTKLERSVLNDLSLNVSEGEFLVLIGGNGAGKSTLFNVISGLIQVDSGSVMLDNIDVTFSSQQYRSQLISKVMQDPKVGTIENMTIYENMSFAFKRGQKRGLQLFYNNDRKKFFKEKLSLVNMGLEDRLDELVCNLSGGQRQVLSVIMAVLRGSKILLLDEVTAALDPSSSEQIMEITNQIIRKEKLTSIMITHNMSHAINYGERLLMLKNGSVIKEYDALSKLQLSPAALIEEF